MIITLTLPPEAREVRRWATEAVKAAAIQGIFEIKHRTGQGLDSNYSSFRPYTPAYRELKTLAGRSARPDLTLTGAMIRGLKLLDAKEGVATIGFTGQHRSTRIVKTKKGRSATVKRTFALKKHDPKSGKLRTVGSFTRTAPLATIVLANDKIRPFFRLTHPRDLKAMADAAQARLDQLTAEFNAST